MDVLGSKVVRETNITPMVPILKLLACGWSTWVFAET